jgi:Ca2+-binding EF-hand superfamily protein
MRLEDAKEKMQQACEKTSVVLRRHIKASYDLRLQIGEHVEATQKTISEAEQHLERMNRQLKHALTLPERSFSSGVDTQNEKLASKCGVLEVLRLKIKGAAYTGTGGRDLGLTFARFDRDRSGELDEDEVRIALRRSCKIPPSVVSDIEIAAFCELLDEDGSGTISVKELVAFLLADTNISELGEHIDSAQKSLETLKAAHEETQEEFKRKTYVWRINEACSKVNHIKGLELDNSPSPKKRSGKVSDCSAASNTGDSGQLHSDEKLPTSGSQSTTLELDGSTSLQKGSSSILQSEVDEIDTPVKNLNRSTDSDGLTPSRKRVKSGSAPPGRRMKALDLESPVPPKKAARDSILAVRAKGVKGPSDAQHPLPQKGVSMTSQKDASALAAKARALATEAISRKVGAGKVKTPKDATDDANRHNEAPKQLGRVIPPSKALQSLCFALASGKLPLIPEEEDVRSTKIGWPYALRKSYSDNTLFSNLFAPTVSGMINNELGHHQTRQM